MTYFKFGIPTNADGSRVTYSPGYHGTMPNCPKGVIIHLYNDKEGYGIAETPDGITQKELTVLTEVDAKCQLSEVKDEEGVFIGGSLVTRWDEEVDDGK